MNQDAADLLLAYIASIDRREIKEGDALVWADLLDDIPFEAAKAAVREYYREESRWVTPAEVRRRALAARKAWKRSTTAPPGPGAVPDADPDDVAAYLRAEREGRWRVDTELHPRPVAALLSGYAAATVIPNGDDVVPEAGGPLSVPCPLISCRAEAGAPCRTLTRGEREPHPVRGRRAGRS
jgi:hypothetical protein